MFFPFIFIWFLPFIILLREFGGEVLKNFPESEKFGCRIGE